MEIPSVYLVNELRVDLAHASTILLGGRQPAVYFRPYCVDIHAWSTLSQSESNCGRTICGTNYAMRQHGSEPSDVSRKTIQTTCDL